jgi:hypothetical protein
MKNVGRKEWQACLADPEGTLSDICDTVAGGVGLLSWVKRKGLTYSTVWQWLANDDRRKEAYTAARITAADALVEEAVEILDQELPTDENGRIDPGMVNLLRCRAEMRRWQAGKLRPAVYGETVRLESEGKISITAVLQEARARIGQTYDPVMEALAAPVGNRSPTDE